MNNHETVTLTRDVEAAVVPVGTPVTLLAGETAHITQSLGGSYTVIVNGNMFRIEGRNADALGLQREPTPAEKAGKASTREELEKQAWAQMKTCYDPEIPVNVVDLGLVYACEFDSLGQDSYRANVKMTLTAPGCGMGPTIQQDVQNKLLCIEGIDEANVDLVWEPQWNRDMMSEAAKLQLGLM
ncbi:MAG: putative Fe-S cluster assembly protein SufT [Pedosphaera sp.]|nr:putative Fe-S cluster assembly protein SufT [Pedosphaera sp.]MSU27173.1 putative Fe-S cluster assembly protein SufT [Pedosphaera sp.]